MSEENNLVTRSFVHYVIIPLMMKESVDEIIVSLVNLGYTVGPLSRTGAPFITKEGNFATILSLTLENTVTDDGEKETRDIVWEDVREVLKATRARYYMLWVGDAGTMFKWNLGNVSSKQPNSSETSVSSKGSQELN